MIDVHWRNHEMENLIEKAEKAEKTVDTEEKEEKKEEAEETVQDDQEQPHEEPEEEDEAVPEKAGVRSAPLFLSSGDFTDQDDED